MIIYCCGCKIDIEARLTNGKEIYPHRPDLGHLPFWKCDKCKNYVGCHHKTRNSTKPLGNIPTKELIACRKKIHALMDPLWLKRTYKRNFIYNHLSMQLGYFYHTAEIKEVKEAEKVIEILKKLCSSDNINSI
jgi:hypothetical protein